LGLSGGVVAGKEVHVKPQTGAKQERGRWREAPDESRVPSQDEPLVLLSEEEKRVLDCLQEAGVGLTLRQLAVRTSLAGPVVERAVDGLLAHNLVARLNTVVPSYACRYPGLRVYSD
jgi:hypothetical protein